MRACSRARNLLSGCAISFKTTGASGGSSSLGGGYVLDFSNRTFSEFFEE